MTNTDLLSSELDEKEPAVDNNSRKVEEKSDDESDKIELCFRRWLVLAVFSLITGLSAFNWIDYVIISDVVISFYNESLPSDEARKIDAVNWFSMVYMLTYIILVFPAMFLLERKGLRLSCALGALLTFLGSSVKCAAVRPDLFAVAIVGQTICAIAQSFTLGTPARLSALWFGPNEIGLATSVSIF
jgi:FLVCR family feline leukemia virus subgroup C receptor-related protein